MLASASPRRSELVALLGLPFVVEPSGYAEPPAPDRPVRLAELVTELAANKAAEVAARFPDDWVLGADTLVTLGDDIGVPLGKPADAEDARRMLSLLSGRGHFVYTGIALITPGSPREPRTVATSACRTGVWFRELSP
ncbi:MAG TPA: Maf family protein, partial [Chthonomonadaceae bacterium]|nr:Maf family protein [Chthonomonadaceae bacterium]